MRGDPDGTRIGHLMLVGLLPQNRCLCAEAIEDDATLWSEYWNARLQGVGHPPCAANRNESCSGVGVPGHVIVLAGGQEKSSRW